MIKESNLKGSAAKGLIWSAIERFGSQGIQFVFGILITRILLPDDYGLIGMILIFIAIGQSLVDSGFGAALIWKKYPTEVDYSTVFYFNISISILLYFVFFFIAPIISRFYEEPQLRDLIRILCLNFLILSLSGIHQIILQKRIDFKLLSIVNISGSLIAGVMALFMAIRGFGVWAIVIQMLTKSFIISLSLWFWNKWRPLLVFSGSSLKQLFKYGSRLTIAGLIYIIFQNLYFNIIGKFFPLTSLGYYTRAVQLQEFPVKTVSSIFSRVAFPVFANISNEEGRLKNAVRKTNKTMVFFTFPMLFGLIAIADLLIEVVLTEKWLPASQYFKLLCVMGLVYSFQILNGEVLKTKGRSDWVLRLEIISKAILLINIFITYKWGITVIILGQIVSVMVAWLVGSYYVWKLIRYSFWQQIKDVLPFLAISLVMYFFIEVISDQISDLIISLVITILAGIIFYISAAWVFKLEEVKEAKIIIKNILGNMNRKSTFLLRFKNNP